LDLRSSGDRAQHRRSSRKDADPDRSADRSARAINHAGVSGSLRLPDEPRALRAKRSFERTKAWASEMGRVPSSDGTEDEGSSASRSDMCEWDDPLTTARRCEDS
jgi:hypothetical protein